MQFDQLKRREFVTLLGGAAVAWPLAARAQQRERMRRIGMNVADSDPEGRAYLDAFVGRLSELGWSVGRNIRIDYRSTLGDAARIRTTAVELLLLAPDVILTVGGTQVGPLQQLSDTIPIVFVQVGDPVGGGFIDSLARPGRNATGFSAFDYSIGAKWLELLKEIAPRLTHVAMLRDARTPVLAQN